MDVTYHLCDGKGCKVCKKSGWLKIMGYGMVHPNGGIDPEEWSGYVFGMGVDRTVLLRHKIEIYDCCLRMICGC